MARTKTIVSLFLVSKDEWLPFWDKVVLAFGFSFAQEKGLGYLCLLRVCSVLNFFHQVLDTKNAHVFFPVRVVAPAPGRCSLQRNVLPAPPWTSRGTTKGTLTGLVKVPLQKARK